MTKASGPSGDIGTFGLSDQLERQFIPFEGVGDMQRFALPFAIVLQLVMVAVALLTGAVPVVAANS